LTRFPASVTDEGGELALALAALHRVPQGGRKRLAIRQIDGLPALESPLREPLLAAGFESDYDALVPARSRQTGSGRDPVSTANRGPRR
jgi:ATP-dependent helicase Lhr and Lhr-like helicase